MDHDDKTIRITQVDNGFVAEWRTPLDFTKTAFSTQPPDPNSGTRIFLHKQELLGYLKGFFD